MKPWYFQMKRFLRFIPVMIFFLACFSTAGAQQSPADVLFVYQTEAEAQPIINLIRASGKTVHAVLNEDYLPGTAQLYPYLVTMSPQPVEEAQAAGIVPVCIGEAFASTKQVEIEKIEDASVSLHYLNFSQVINFESQLSVITNAAGLETIGEIDLSMRGRYPFAVFSETEVLIPYLNQSDLSMILLGAVFQKHFGNSEPGSMYVLIDEIYPFSDLGMLCDTADLLYKNAIPFIVRMMPVYDNLDYPAFLRYAQVLRFIQSRNGTIVIHDPIVRNEMIREPLDVKMDRMTNALAAEGIHWMPTDHMPFLLQNDTLDTIQSSQKNFGVLPVNTMIELTLPESSQELEASIKKINQKWLSLNDYKRNFTNENYQYNEIQIDEQYKYDEEADVDFLEFFTIGNRFLLLAVSVSLVLFLIILLIGFRLYWKKFYRKPNGEQ